MLAGFDCTGRVLGQVSDGNRKDVRNAVEAAHKAAPGWGKRAAHNRAQIVYYMAGKPFCCQLFPPARLRPTLSIISAMLVWLRRGYGYSFAKEAEQKLIVASSWVRAGDALWLRVCARANQAENLELRRAEFASQISSMTGGSMEEGLKEVDASIARLFHWAAYADKSVATIFLFFLRGRGGGPPQRRGECVTENVCN
jgi:hypothetical protein